MMLTKIFNRTSSFRVHPHLVIIMLTVLTGLFSSSPQAEEKKLRHHQINLSGNIFHFSMPEDFSRDMPAADIVESLDISDITKFDNPEYGNLVRRWWDIKKPGWFGKQLGTVMMDISVQKVVSNKRNLLHSRPYDIKDRMDFMLMLDDSFHQRYESLNEEMESPGRTAAYHSSFLNMIGSRIETNYREFALNQQKWIENGIVGPRSDLIIILAIPLGQEVYMEASFTLTKNDNITLRDFRGAAFERIDRIKESFRIYYKKGNSVGDIVGQDWMAASNDDVLLKHHDALIDLLQGANQEVKKPD